MRCVRCGKTGLTPSQVWREVKGWVRDRTQGGHNAITKEERTGRVMCNGCMEAEKLGLNPGQGTLG